MRAYHLLLLSTYARPFADVTRLARDAPAKVSISQPSPSRYLAMPRYTLHSLRRRRRWRVICCSKRSSTPRYFTDGNYRHHTWVIGRKQDSSARRQQWRFLRKRLACCVWLSILFEANLNFISHDGIVWRECSLMIRVFNLPLRISQLFCDFKIYTIALGSFTPRYLFLRSSLASNAFRYMATPSLPRSIATPPGPRMRLHITVMVCLY